MRALQAWHQSYSRAGKPLQLRPVFNECYPYYLRCLEEIRLLALTLTTFSSDPLSFTFQFGANLYL